MKTGSLIHPLEKNGPVSFYVFIAQMLDSPKSLKYIGDDKFQDSTQVPKSKQPWTVTPVPPDDASGSITTTAGINAVTIMALPPTI
jgi:hypothetical protein